jgi:hypothetical protein
VEPIRRSTGNDSVFNEIRLGATELQGLGLINDINARQWLRLSKQSRGRILHLV